MARSSINKTSRRTKDKQRKVNIKGNPIIAKNWDYSKTLTQNYKRLGLVSKLDKPAGGQEADLSKVIRKNAVVKAVTIADEDSSDEEEEEEEDESMNDIKDEELNSDGEFDENKIPEGEARIQRDKDGQVLKVFYGKKKMFDIDQSVESLKATRGGGESTEVVKQLEEYSNRPIAPKIRKQSSREEEWIERLFKKHGDNYKKMAFDTKLNVNQQTEADLKKRIMKWKKKQGIN
ncbi:probable Nucleolar protein 16 [Saccharomycodes ludwigii]|uniref:Nucleolar protein 16 n=2 Tax=Saccharomycodes ludwigii TaxID=36035 RepID=A0A376B4B4_9ASCO|nr:probable Nucleolar protein 16 [Saccharomycodes ludwigii]